jgi:hypothetical protein
MRRTFKIATCRRSKVKERNNKKEDAKKGALITGYYIFTPRR